MPCIPRKLLALAVFALLTFFPNVSFAATQQTCECFCGENGKGAMDMDQLTNSACKKTCSDTNTTFVGCYGDAQEYPDHNPKCWSEHDCSTWSGLNGTTAITAVWQGAGNMPYDCMASKSSDAETAYCYADSPKFQLNIPIGTLTEVGDLPTYINTIYTWLLPAAALVAVVMMMLGGLQYVLSRGKEKYISKGKERITNAITGLVLLLSVFVILNLIDPRLTSLNPLKIPMIKEVTLLDPASSCERLQDYKYTVQVDSGKTAACGGTGKVTHYPPAEESVLGSWKVNDACDYMKCSGKDEGKTCMRDGSINSCKSCADIPSPSESNCSSAEKFNAVGGETQEYCEFDSKLNSCVTAGTKLDKKAGFSCGALQTAAKVGEDKTKWKGCAVYEDLEAWYTVEQVGVGGRKLFPTTLNSPLGLSLLKTVCNDDKCEIAKAVKASKCSYNTGSADPGYIKETLSLFFSSVSLETTGYFCHTF